MTAHTKTLTDAFVLDEALSEGKKQALRDMQLDFATILSDVPFKEKVNWSRVTKTEDSMGKVSSASSWTYAIELIIQPLTQKDRNILPEGIQIRGHLKAYSKWRYKVGDGLKSIEPGDTITRNNDKEYMVTQLTGGYGGNSLEVFRKLILREIDND